MSAPPLGVVFPETSGADIPVCRIRALFNRLLERGSMMEPTNESNSCFQLGALTVAKDSRKRVAYSRFRPLRGEEWASERPKWRCHTYAERLDGQAAARSMFRWFLVVPHRWRLEQSSFEHFFRHSKFINVSQKRERLFINV